jgi:hypothetical protein
MFEGLELGYVQGVIDIFRIKVLKMEHPSPVLHIVDRILNFAQNSFIISFVINPIYFIMSS